VGSRPSAWSPGSSRQLQTEAASGINVGLSGPKVMERNMGTWDSDVNGEATSGRTTFPRAATC
jgi:hypothetical protein